MSIVDDASLSATLDAVNEALFFGRKLSQSERREAAVWIAGRRGLPGAYAGMFAPTEKDFREGATFFTGESIRTGAGAAHILGEEACRALILLGVKPAPVRDALEEATAGMARRFRAEWSREQKAGRPWLGRYCCSKCSVALWRHLAAGGLERAEYHLHAALKGLKPLRTANGRWQHYPFWYTLLAVSEIELPAALAELRHAAPACERAVRRIAEEDTFAQRRRALAERCLARC